MELEEMKQAWQALDRRLVQQQALNWRTWRDGQADRLRRGLRPLVWGQMAQIALGVLVAVLAGSFWVARLHVTHLLVCGVLLHLYGLALIGFAARTLYLIHHIDHAAPVLAIQRQLAELRAWRVRVEGPFNAVAGCFVWILVLWVNLAWYGLDIWAGGRSMAWMALSAGVGLAGVGLVVWVMRATGRGRRLEDHAAGKSLQKAEALLAEIERFQQE
ncbi:MAG TPA: hypothetical protein VGU65_15135 [Frateuria sp.]|uniref:hypothetical protein n=1 Tax=Frateuria sp. TaxID=2211372 RepID=UPI002DF49B0A|nr:hypothetical protein [Frateuria sp.]